MPEETREQAGKKFEIVCGKCSGRFRSNPAMIGRKVLCPFCGVRLTVPEAGEIAAADDSGRSAASAVSSQGPPGSTGGGKRPILIGQPQPGAGGTATTSASPASPAPVPAVGKPGSPQAVPSGAPQAMPTSDGDSQQSAAEAEIAVPEPTAEVADPTLTVQEQKTRLVRVGNELVEVRRLTADEKAARRFKRNILMMLFGAILLAAVVMFLAGR